MDDTRLCVVPGRPHQATDGQLCHDHYEELGRWLHDIEEEVVRLEVAPSLATRWDSGGGSLASQRSPVVLDALVYLDDRSTAHGYRRIGPVCVLCPTLAGRRCTCPPLDYRRIVHWAGCPQFGVHPSCLGILGDRDEQTQQGALPGEEKPGNPGTDTSLSVLAVLSGWAQMVRDGRMLGLPVRQILVRVPPGHEGPYVVDRDGTIGATTLIPAELTITGERDVLSRHLRWIIDQDWVLDMRRELAQIRAQLQRANKNEPDKPLPGWCPWLDEHGVECGGHLWPEQAPAFSTGYDTDGPLQPRAIVCGLNPTHRWETAGDRARLSLIVADQQRKDQAS